MNTDVIESIVEDTRYRLSFLTKEERFACLELIQKGYCRFCGGEEVGKICGCWIFE